MNKCEFPIIDVLKFLTYLILMNYKTMNVTNIENLIKGETNI